jgi:hypothetical protein
MFAHTIISKILFVFWVTNACFSMPDLRLPSFLENMAPRHRNTFPVERQSYFVSDWTRQPRSGQRFAIFKPPRSLDEMHGFRAPSEPKVVDNEGLPSPSHALGHYFFFRQIPWVNAHISSSDTLRTSEGRVELLWPVVRFLQRNTHVNGQPPNLTRYSKKIEGVIVTVLSVTDSRRGWID